MRMKYIIIGLLLSWISPALATTPTTANYSNQIPTNAFSITIPNWANVLALNPSGTLASGTITMPAAPTDGQTITITSTQNITTLTHSANTGQTLNSALTTLPASTSASWVYNSATGTWISLGNSTDAAGTQATQTISYQPGLLTALNATKAAFVKFVKASTVDNIEGSANTFSCVSNPTITLFECGVSTTCATPTTIGTVTITAAGTVVDGTVSAAAITAGDYVAFAETAGTCASSDIAVQVQAHSN